MSALLRGLIALPLLALATYFGRIASQHRETERYLALLASQLNTIGAYTDALDDEAQKRELLVLLGKRAFSDPGLEARDKGKLSVIPEDVLPLLEKAMDIAKDTVKKKVKPEP